MLSFKPVVSVHCTPIPQVVMIMQQALIYFSSSQ